MRLLFALLSLSLMFGTVQAQDLELESSKQALELSRLNQEKDIQWIHMTPTLSASPEGRAASAEYHMRKEMGLIPTGKGSQFVIGETRNFAVLNIKESQTETVEFTLMAEHSFFNVWVESSQLASNGGNVTDADIAAMVTAAGVQTPSGSVNPNKGIVENDEAVFGPPSDVDGSGKMDILLHDIKDFYDPANNNFGAVAGFFSPADLSSNSNQADIIHLDTMPGMYRQDGSPVSQANLHRTLAHEYEHLIMQANKGFEATFVSEGQAEWAEVVNGYSPRTVSYINSAIDRAASLLSWDNGPPYGGPASQDYQRAGLWSNYLADRLGTDLAGEISRTSGNGYGTYASLLTKNGFPLSLLEDYVQGFHVANLINDGSSVANFGYTTPSRQSLRAKSIPTTNGESAVGSTDSGVMNSGSVRYFVWENVGSFSLDLDAGSTSQRDDLKPILIFDDVDSGRSFAEVDPGGEGVVRTGNFSNVYLVTPHVDLSTTATVGYNFTASWETFTAPKQFEDITYDDGVVQHTGTGSITIIGIPVSGENILAIDDKFANRFETPPGSAFSEISLSLLFMDAFQSTNSTTRDFRLSVWNEIDGVPGDVVMSEVFEYNAGIDAPNLAFMTIDMAPWQNELSQATGPLFVGFENAGIDNNYIYFALSHTALTTSPSYMFNSFGSQTQRWAHFDSVTSGGNPAFNGLVLPIRVRVDLNAGSTDVDGGIDLPETIVLDQNYPNPFNPSTTIQFELPNSSDVELEVFDLLGRKVATLIQGVLQAGSHEAMFDATVLGSGLYVYTLRAGDHRMTRTMTLIK